MTIPFRKTKNKTTAKNTQTLILFQAGFLKFKNLNQITVYKKRTTTLVLRRHCSPVIILKNITDLRYIFKMSIFMALFSSPAEAGRQYRSNSTVSLQGLNTFLFLTIITVKPFSKESRHFYN